MSACIPKVDVALHATPTVSLTSSEVSVVAAVPSCRAVSNAVASHLSERGMLVRPNARTRVSIVACEDQVHGSQDLTEVRSQAIATVHIDGLTNGHLLGTSSDTARTRNRARSAGIRSVAADLADQVTPLDRTTRRRVYSNTGADGARALHNRAVAAEREGRVAEALWWAERALELGPSVPRARYVSELTRRVSRTGALPL